MAMKIITATHGDACVFQCDGRITLGEGSVTLRDAVREALRGRAKLLVLDMGGVDYIDSSGIGELVSAYTVARNSGANLVLVSLRKKIIDLLHITKLYTVFTVYESVEAALAAPGVPQVKP
jgi:anti-sigma B factor antagonist